jgi:hypothetical protein
MTPCSKSKSPTPAAAHGPSNNAPPTFALILAAEQIPRTLDGRILSDLYVVDRPDRTTFHVRAWYTETP